MKKIGLLFFTLPLLLISYSAGAKISQPSGNQKVHYIPSKKECFEGKGSVSWKYCIHVPASNSTNGDIL